MGSIRVVRGGDLSVGEQGDGIARRMDQVDEHVSLALATIGPSVVSGWHHHGDHTSCVYVLKGSLHIDWGPGGREGVDLTAGDFYVVPPNTIHREGNTGPHDDVQLAAFYLGSGPVLVNLEGAEPTAGVVDTMA